MHDSPMGVSPDRRRSTAACEPVPGGVRSFFDMDMKHDFPHDPDIRVQQATSRTLRPEAFVIGSIVLVFWLIFALHLLKISGAW